MQEAVANPYASAELGAGPGAAQLLVQQLNSPQVHSRIYLLMMTLSLATTLLLVVT